LEQSGSNAAFEKAIRSGVKAGHFFEGCLPVEIIAERGVDSLAFGPMRPVGLRDPRTGRRPYAVVQLRQDNLAGSLYNLVGFQTNLVSEQAAFVIGLENARFTLRQMIATLLLQNQPLTPSILRDELFSRQIAAWKAIWAISRRANGGTSGAFHHHENYTAPNDDVGALCHCVHADLKDANESEFWNSASA
jgi:hypothetical protein